MDEKEKQLKPNKKQVKWFNGKKKLLFLESIGNHKTPRDVMLKNLIKVLEKNGFVIKNKKKKISIEFFNLAHTFMIDKDLILI